MAGSGADIFDQSIEHCIAVRLEVPELRVRNAAQVVIAQHRRIQVARAPCGSCHRTDEVLIVTPAGEP